MLPIIDAPAGESPGWGGAEDAPATPDVTDQLPAFHNESVQAYNTRIGLFPNNLIASMFNFPRSDARLKTEPAARTMPQGAFRGERGAISPSEM